MRALSALPLRMIACVTSCVLMLSACAQEEPEGQPASQANSDPLMSAALADQIMVDPDMVNRNAANRVASFGPDDGAVPLPDSGSQAAMAAREEAIELLGGTTALRRAPPPERVSGELPEEAALSVAARAASAGEGMGDCASIAEFSAIWAARLPEAFPVYPRGAVHEAAGTDEGECALRVVNYSTPVSLNDVMDFYFTRATAEGFSIQRIVQDGDDVLGGTLDARTFMVFARADEGGMTSVDLVTSGN